jgi:hypothetical protein
MMPREIQTEYRPEHTTYNFPLRPIGAFRLIGLLPMAFAVFWAWMPGQQFFRSMRHATQAGGGFEWFFVGFLSLFLLAALIPFCLGLFILLGQTRLEVRRDRIIVTEIAGPIRRSRKVRFADIDRLEVASRPGAPARGSPVVDSLARLSGLSAVLKNGKKRLLVVAYPRDWVESVAEEVSGLIGQQGIAPAIAHLDALTGVEAALKTEELAPKPADSKVSLEPGPNGILVAVPPLGLWKGSKGMVGFAVVWCLFMAVFTAAMIFGKSREPHGPLAAWAFVGMFWMIGASMLAVAIHLGVRRATLSAGGDGLRVEQKGLFGAKSREWRRGEITALRSGPSGMRVNNVPVMELQIYAVTGKKKVGLLAGRSDAELRWLASELRRTLGVPAQAQDSSVPAGRQP